MKNRKRFVAIMAGILVAAMILGFLAMLLPTRVSAASSSEIRSQIDELESQSAELDAQIAELDAQMQANLDDMRDVVDQKNRIDQQVFLLCEQIDNINEQIAAYGVLIADKQEELDAAEKRYAELSDKNRERVRAMEEEGVLSYWSVLFKASSFSDLLDRINMIEEINASDQRRLRELDEAAKAVEQAREELEQEKAGLEAKRADLAATQEELEAKRTEADELLANLLARGEEFEAYMEEAEAKQQELMRQIAQKEDEYDAAAYQEWLATYVPPTTAAPTSGGSDSSGGGESGGDDGDDGSGGGSSSSSEGWITPVPWYILTSPFGWRTHPIYGDQRFHEGVDLACNEGTSIYASRGGQVSAASYNDSMGFYVQINHGDGYKSIYMHMTHSIVSAGEYVAQGQTIGYVGSTGDSTGPHLHFGISLNGEYVNPMNYI